MSNLFSRGISELRDKLIDTSRRNKLINYKRPNKSKNLQIIDESAEFIYNYLVKEEGKFKFKFIPEPLISKEDLAKLDEEIKEHKEELKEATKIEDEDAKKQLLFLIEGLEEEKKELQRQALLTAEERAKELAYDISKELPEIDINDSDVEEKYTDDSLQTLHYPNEMEKILTSIERDARSIIEETGSNMLYLVLGLLKWKEAKNSEQFNSSPLISIPIVLNKEKKNNKYEFTLEYSGAGIDTNRSLAEKLNNDFGIILPELTEEHTYYEYLKEVKEVIQYQKEWSLKHEIAIDFLKFGKILMYQDLKEENWQEGTPLSDKKIFIDIFEGKEISEASMFAEEYDIDSDILANNIPLVMNADSSQHSAIVDVLNGKNVVIEGPPGTGKSQTISNLIAVLLSEGKSVLFVSEKLAALEVVYKRLDSIGLSDFCLELHSNKSQKIKILESIKKRVETKYGYAEYIETTIEQIEAKKKELKAYIDLLHEPYGGIEKKAYTIFWLVEKYNSSSKYLIFDVPNANEYSAYKLSNTIEELKKYKTFLKEYDFNTFYWKGLDTFNLNFVDIDSFIEILRLLKNNFTLIQKEYDSLNINISNEYQETKKIYEFIKEFDEADFKDFSKEILSRMLVNSNEYNEYLHNYLNIKNKISDITKNVEGLETYIELFEKTILNIVKIDKILKHIKNETNLSNNKNIEYIFQLSIGIKYLTHINLELYCAINQNYLDVSFSKNFDNMKKDLLQYETLKDSLSTVSKISEIDNLIDDEINSIQKIIEEKKNSFFNFFSGEYKQSKNKIESMLLNSLPSDKTKWSEILNQIKEYVLFKNQFEQNNDYIQYFGKLFEGTKTKIDDIERLHNWVLVIKKDINITEILTLLLSGDDTKYNLLTSYKDSLTENLESYNESLIELEKNCDKKFLKKLYYDRNDVDILELKDKLENINNDIDNYISSIYKNTNINKNNNFNDELFNLLKNNTNLEEIFDSVKRYDVGINDLLFNFEDFIGFAKKLSILLEDKSFDLSEQTYELILNTKNLFDFITQSSLDTNLQNRLCENFEIINTLKDISNIEDSIKKVYSEIEKKGTINDSFFGENIKISDCINKLDNVDENKKTLSIWINYRQITHDLINLGLNSIVEKLEEQTLPIDEIVKNFKYNFYHTLLKEIFRNNPIFNRFSRLSHEQTIQSFNTLDLKLIELNKRKVAYLTSQKEIPLGYRGNRKSDLTEFSLLENELNKKKRHIPIRQLVSRASGALKALKPCFMMSPLSVSQYLPPNQVEFDVLIVDEASQLRPEEALGSIARVNQIVIVGDPKQLPPTSFFDSMNKNEDEDTVASESESILDICLNLYKPIRQLRWHYRSQHESLIDFSNQQFYDGNLIVFPSPSSKNNEELGVKYHYIENSAYQSSRNKVEAKIIVEHLEKQMKNYPDKSIGIGTFNSTQRDLIQDMVDEREKESPIISNYIAKWSKTSEAFFIKNLENLQGDERDVILISTTFGKDKDTGRVYQRFGPINSDTGWRRLNVLFTRSKQKMEIFTSMKSSDIIISETSSRGVRALKAFLNYLEKGVVSELPEITNRDFDSEFEISVYNILKDCGFECVPQVGVAGYFIDLAVSAIKNPTDFVLAIECDGATYHSSKSARDRDRLKQDVLETLGWNVYRIWSVDWYKNRENEISKLIKIVKEAQAIYHGKNQSICVQEIEVKEIKSLEKNIIEEIKKEKDDSHQKEETISKPNYLQEFFPDEKIKEMLIKLRDDVISQDFTIDRRCILSDMMIELFVKHKPINIDEFREKIPKRYRDERIIHIEQLKYLNDIFDILELGDE
jgi:superfamily I DNA and/or RNA helicase/KaiC/GvpD/RAD55 family RecA-like ATPase